MLKRSIDNDCCEDIGEDTAAPPEENLTEFGFAYCPPRVACVDSLSSLDSSDNDSSNGDDQIAEEEILPIYQSNIGKEEESETQKKYYRA